MVTFVCAHLVDQSGATDGETTGKTPKLRNGLQNLMPRNQNYRSVVCCETHFDIMNRLGVDRECDGQTDGQNGFSNSAL